MFISRLHDSIRTLLACGWLGLAGLATAEPAPTPPVIPPPEPGSQWSVEIRTGGKTPGSTPRRLEMRFGQNKIEQGTLEYANGQKGVYYSDGTNILMRHDGTVVMLRPDDFPPVVIQSGLFIGFSPGVWWRSGRFYAGIETVDNIQCYVYKKPNGAAPQVAWLRVSNGFPVKIQIGETTLVFSSSVPFPNNVELPPDIAEKMEKMTAQTNALRRILDGK